jgi:hypothetical protein
LLDARAGPQRLTDEEEAIAGVFVGVDLGAAFDVVADDDL